MISNRDAPATECGGKGKECREDRFARQEAENEEVLQESARVLRSVADILDAAARRIGRFGDEPFKDLEH